MTRPASRTRTSLTTSPRATSRTAPREHRTAPCSSSPSDASTSPGHWLRWAASLCHPLPLVAVLALTVNDHVLKGSGALPAVVTGKLSDVVGLFFFPLVVAALLALLLRGARLRVSDAAVGGVAVLATGLVFAGIKLSPGVNLAVERLWAPNALDPTDLLALPMLGLSWAWMRRKRPSRGSSTEVTAIVVAGLASIATQIPRYERVYPQWETPGLARLTVGCATVEAWVAKTGKQGAGVTLAAKATALPCRLTVLRSRFVVGELDVPSSEAPAVIDLASGSARHLWLSHLFDGDATWNAGLRAGVLVLDLEVGGEMQTWEVPVSLTIDGGNQFRRIDPAHEETRSAQGGAQ